MEIQIRRHLKDMRIFLLYALFFSAFALHAQQEPLNQRDASGKPDGKWIVYLDAKWNKTDSSKAVYYRYTWFDHGVNIHPMGPGSARMETTADSSKQDRKIKLLDGEYKWYDAKGRLKYMHVFKNGEYVAYKEYYSSGGVQTFIDYTKHCENQPHSWTLYLYDKKGNLTLTSPTCKDKKGQWPKMRG